MPTTHTHRIGNLVARPDLNGVLCTPASFIASHGRVSRAVVNTDDHGVLCTWRWRHSATPCPPGCTHASLRAHVGGNYLLP